jgi:lactobin A/cerein 7B family class IIb bacteriocin
MTTDNIDRELDNAERDELLDSELDTVTAAASISVPLSAALPRQWCLRLLRPRPSTGSMAGDAAASVMRVTQKYNRKSVMAVTAARAGACHIGLISHLHGGKLMTKHQTNTIDTSTNIENKKTQLTEEELKNVSGGILRTGLAVVHEGERIVAA